MKDLLLPLVALFLLTRIKPQETTTGPIEPTGPTGPQRTAIRKAPVRRRRRRIFKRKL